MTEKDSEAATHGFSPSERRAHRLAALAAALVLFVTILFVPNCKRYFKERQIRGIQAASIIDLRLIADHEEAFYKRYGFYTTDLKALGVAPKKVLYKFGFVSPSAAVPVTVLDLDPSRKDLDALKKAVPNLEIEYSPVTKLDKVEFDRLTSFCADCTATASGFKAIAAANLDDDPVLDVWSIDEKGNVVHLVDDLQ